jgi:hypothetical protein
MMQATALCSCLFLFAACAKKAPVVAKTPAGNLTRLAQSVQEDIGKMQAATASVRGLAWIVLNSEARAWQTEAAIVIVRPDKLRVDVIDALADVWTQIGSDGRDMWLFLPDKGKLYKGRASARNVRRLASFDAKPAELLSIVSGVPPLPEGAALVQVGPLSEGHLVDETSGLHVWVERGKRMRVVRCARYADDGEEMVYEVVFSDYRRIGGVEFPYVINASFPAGGASLVLEYRDVTLGDEVAPGIFGAPSRRSRKTVELSEEK